MAKAPARNPTKADVASLLDLLAHLADAGTPREVAAVLVQLVRDRGADAAATVVWEPDGKGRLQCEPAIDLSEPQAALALTALARPQTGVLRDGIHAALRLADAPAAILLPEPAAAVVQQALQQPTDALHVAARHLRRALDAAALEDEHKRLAHSERLQRALFAIADLLYLSPWL